MRRTRLLTSLTGIALLLIGAFGCESPSDLQYTHPEDPLNPDYVTPPELLDEEFSDGKSAGWSIYGSGNVLTGLQSDGTEGYLYELGINSKAFYVRNNSLSWTDYIFECDVLNRSGAWTLILFRIQDQTNYYSLSLIPDMDLMSLDVWRDGEQTNLGSYNYNLANNAWYHLKIVVGGSTMACYVDTLQTPVLKAQDATFKKGGIGLWSWHNKTWFDNVTVAGKMTTQVYVGAVRTNGFAYNVDVAGSRAYVADGIRGLTIVDISSMASPKLMGGENDKTTAAYGVKIEGRYTYLANWQDGITVIDIFDSWYPILRWAKPTPGFAYGIDLKDLLILVANGDSGLMIFNTKSTGNEPLRAGTLDTPGYSYDLDIADNFVYLADGEAGLQVIDVADSTNPVLIGSYDTEGTVYDVVVSGDYAYVADGDSGLVILDISNPALPIQEGRLAIDGMARGIDIQDYYVYVAAGPGGLAVVDVSDPQAPEYAEEFNLDGFAYGVRIYGSYAFVACGSAGLIIVTAISGL